jgi:2,2-dialkylglycine decarboxylase (pyruvate)
MPGAYAILEPNCYRCPLKLKPENCAFACLNLSFELIDKESVGELAAAIVEPILSAGGVIVPPEGYLPKLKEMCEKREMLLIFDEAITGIARTGSMFAFEDCGTVPDILALSKSLGGGIPLSSVSTSATIEEAIFNKDFLHISSHENDPLPTRTGLAVLEVVQEENLVQQAKEKGAFLKKQLQEMADRHEIIGDVRGKGLLIGVELVRDRETKERAIEEGANIFRKCQERGLLINHLKESISVFRIAPPLTISQEYLDRAIQMFDEAIRDAVGD